jgi:hypothetical protein
MRSAWGAFIADPEHGLKDLGWPTYNPAGEFKQINEVDSFSNDFQARHLLK